MILIRQGDSGFIIGKIQQALRTAGLEIDVVELITQRFGTSTLDAVRNFQACHVGPGGHRMLPNGIVDPETIYALSYPERSKIK